MKPRFDISHVWNPYTPMNIPMDHPGFVFCPSIPPISKEKIMSENIIALIEAQAAPLFAQGAEEVTAAMCCQKVYVGPPPERLTCSTCQAAITAIRWPRAVPAADIVSMLLSTPASA